MKTLTSRLGVGPMSSEVIEAVYQSSQERREQIMLVASKNQIDHSGGYVNGWDTRRYADFLSRMRSAHPHADVLVCRDHCGPGFSGGNLADAYRTAEVDIDCGFDLINVDLSRLGGDHSERLCQTKELIRFIKGRRKEVMIEVGTPDDLEYALSSIVTCFQPEFCAVHTGSRVRGDRQVGRFDPGVVKAASSFLRDIGIRLKEHDADYLSDDQIRARAGLVGAVNVTQAFGVLQTGLLLSQCHRRGLDASEFLRVSFDSMRWAKWSHGSDRYHCALVAGHYNFRTDAYRRLADEIPGFRQEVIDAAKEVIDRYLDNLKGCLT